MKKPAIIVSVIVLIAGGCKNLPKQETNACISSSEKSFDRENEFNEWEMAMENLVEFKSDYNFETFKTKVFTGKLANPDFTDNEFAEDIEYVDFITEECKAKSINFGGHYTIISKSCGCMCQHIFVIDRITGKIFATELERDEYGDTGKWGYLYKPDSKLLIANSEVFMNFDSLNYYTTFFGNAPELYVWTGENFKRIQ